jgi:hypothetical protein
MARPAVLATAASLAALLVGAEGFVFGNNDCERVRRRARRVQANGGVRALTKNGALAETRLPFCPHNLVRGLFIV